MKPKLKLNDFTKSGTADDLRENLASLAKRIRAAGVVLYSREDLDIACRVYPSIAESTARQLELLARLADEAIEVTANVCRTVFEINVALRYCLSAKTRLDDYADQAGTDEISIYKAVRSLAHGHTNPTNVAQLDAHIEQIKEVLRRNGRSLKPERQSIFQMAKEIGLQDEYQSMYKIYCKYVHASAWFVLRKREHIDVPMFRWQFQLHTQLYAADTLARLESVKDDTEQQFREGRGTSPRPSN